MKEFGLFRKLVKLFGMIVADNGYFWDPGIFNDGRHEDMSS